MKSVTVVGSGASGAHFALSVLRKGYQVHMLDVGVRKPTAVRPDDSFQDLKSNLPDPVSHFLGSRFEAVLFPGNADEYYGFPPSKSYVFEQPRPFSVRASGFAPLSSFARGGLAEAWTGGCYPCRESELADFPIRYQDLHDGYSEVARRIGINGELDDMERFYPDHEALLPPLKLDEHARVLVSRYERRKQSMQSAGCYLGRSRVATLSVQLDPQQLDPQKSDPKKLDPQHLDTQQPGRGPCTYLGRCLWGCPVRALYTPESTLEECLRFPTFRYEPGLYVERFETDGAGRVTRVVATQLDPLAERTFDVETLVLAAGTLASARIFLRAIRHATGQSPRLTGLMDNRQILVPFVNLRMIGKDFNPDSYQYHQLAMGFESDDPRDYVHAQITTLKTALVHPIVQNVPFDLRTSLNIFRNVHAALGLVNVNLRDTRRDENYVMLDGGSDAGAALTIRYEPPPGERALIRRVLQRVKRALWKLGCVVPPGMVHVRPMGASVHYAGLIPMSRSVRPLTASPECKSHDFDNLYFVDGTTFPFLPAKNLTFTLMANAVRVATLAF